MAEVQTVEQITRQAPFMEDYIRKLLESAYQQTQTAQEVPAIQVAGLTPEQQRAQQLAEAGVGAYQPFLEQAGQAYGQAGQVGGTAPGIAQAAGIGALGAYSPQVTAAFMDPYEQQVVQAATQDILRGQEQAGRQLGATASGLGAFGRSRQAVMQGELGRGAMDAIARTAAQLRSGGYQQALGQQRALAATTLGAGQLGADVGLRTAGLMGTLGGQQAQLGALGQQLRQQDIAQQLGIGSLLQSQRQAELDALRQTQLAQQYEPYQRMAYFGDILRGVPSSQQTIAATTTPSQSPLTQMAGIAATGLGLAGQLGYKPFG